MIRGGLPHACCFGGVDQNVMHGREKYDDAEIWCCRPLPGRHYGVVI